MGDGSFGTQVQHDGKVPGSKGKVYQRHSFLVLLSQGQGKVCSQ